MEMCISATVGLAELGATINRVGTANKRLRR